MRFRYFFVLSVLIVADVFLQSYYATAKRLRRLEQKGSVESRREWGKYEQGRGMLRASWGFFSALLGSEGPVDCTGGLGRVFPRLGEAELREGEGGEGMRRGEMRLRRIFCSSEARERIGEEGGRLHAMGRVDICCPPIWIAGATVPLVEYITFM